MPLPEVAMVDALGGAEVARNTSPPASPRAWARAFVASGARSRARLFWGIGLVWVIASTAVAAGLLQRARAARSAVASSSAAHLDPEGR